MKKIQYTKHLLNRLSVRKLSKRLVRFVFFHPNTTLVDNLNKTYILIGKKDQNYFMIAYMKSKDVFVILTIHQIKKSQIESRIRNKRWITKGDPS